MKSLVVIADVFDRIIADPSFENWMEEANIGTPGIIDDQTHVWMLFHNAAEAALFKMRWLV